MVRHPEAQDGEAGKKKVSEGGIGGPVHKKYPPQETDLLPDPEDKGKSYSGAGKINDLDADGKPIRPKKMKDFDIYKDHK